MDIKTINTLSHFITYIKDARNKYFNSANMAQNIHI